MALQRMTCTAFVAVVIGVISQSAHGRLRGCIVLPITLAPMAEARLSRLSAMHGYLTSGNFEDHEAVRRSLVEVLEEAACWSILCPRSARSDWPGPAALLDHVEALRREP